MAKREGVAEDATVVRNGPHARPAFLTGVTPSTGYTMRSARVRCRPERCSGLRPLAGAPRRENATTDVAGHEKRRQRGHRTDGASKRQAFSTSVRLPMASRMRGSSACSGGSRPPRRHTTRRDAETGTRCGRRNGLTELTAPLPRLTGIARPTGDATRGTPVCCQPALSSRLGALAGARRRRNAMTDVAAHYAKPQRRRQKG